MASLSASKKKSRVNPTDLGIARRMTLQCGDADNKKCESLQSGIGVARGQMVMELKECAKSLLEAAKLQLINKTMYCKVDSKVRKGSWYQQDEDYKNLMENVVEITATLAQVLSMVLVKDNSTKRSVITESRRKKRRGVPLHKRPVMSYSELHWKLADERKEKCTAQHNQIGVTSSKHAIGDMGRSAPLKSEVVVPSVLPKLADKRKEKCTVQHNRIGVTSSKHGGIVRSAPLKPEVVVPSVSLQRANSPKKRHPVNDICFVNETKDSKLNSKHGESKGNNIAASVFEPGSGLCPICQSDDEDWEHVILDCRAYAEPRDHLRLSLESLGMRWPDQKNASKFVQKLLYGPIAKPASESVKKFIKHMRKERAELV